MGGVIQMFILASLLVALPAQTAGQEATDSCVACHTDSAKLRALVKAPPETVDEEGEG